MHPEFIKEFGAGTPGDRYTAFAQFVYHVKKGGGFSAVLPPSSQRDLTLEILRPSSKSAALVCSDWHIDYHDAEWAKFAFAMGEAFKCDEFVIPGDFLDVAAFAKFDPDIFGTKPLLEDELRPAEEILGEGVKRFGHIDLCLGNHEWRFWRKVLQAQLLPDRFLRLMTVGDNVEISEFSYIILRVGEREVRITHPRNYSQVAGRVGARLAEKFRTDFIVAHDHRLAYVRDASGENTVIHCGMMADVKRLPYVNVVDSVNPQMNQGFAIVTATETYLFDARNCDRERWLYMGKKEKLDGVDSEGKAGNPRRKSRNSNKQG